MKAVSSPRQRLQSFGLSQGWHGHSGGAWWPQLVLLLLFSGANVKGLILKIPSLELGRALNIPPVQSLQ